MNEQSQWLEAETLKREFAFQLARALQVDPMKVYQALNVSLNPRPKDEFLLEVECHGASAASQFPQSALALSLDEFSNRYIRPMIYMSH